MNKERYIELLKKQIKYLQDKIEFCEKTEMTDDLLIYKNKLDVLKKIIIYPLYIKIISSNEVEIDDYINEKEQEISIEKNRLTERINNINIAEQELDKKLHDIELRNIYGAADSKKEQLMSVRENRKQTIAKNKNTIEYLNNKISNLDLEYAYAKDETKVGLACQAIGLLLSNPETVKHSLEEIINSNDKYTNIKALINDENKKKEFFDIVGQISDTNNQKYTVKYEHIVMIENDLKTYKGPQVDNITGTTEELLNYVEYDSLMKYNKFLGENNLKNSEGHIDKIFQPFYLNILIQLENAIKKINNSQDRNQFLNKNFGELIYNSFSRFSSVIGDTSMLMDLKNYVHILYNPLDLKARFKMTDATKLMYFYNKKGMTDQLYDLMSRKMSELYEQIVNAYKQKLGYNSDTKLFGLMCDYKRDYYKLCDKGLINEETINGALNIKNQIYQQIIEQQKKQKELIKKLASMLENNEVKFDRNSELTGLIKGLSNVQTVNEKDNNEIENAKEEISYLEQATKKEKLQDEIADLKQKLSQKVTSNNGVVVSEFDNTHLDQNGNIISLSEQFGEKTQKDSSLKSR